MCVLPVLSWKTQSIRPQLVAIKSTVHKFTLRVLLCTSFTVYTKLAASGVIRWEVIKLSISP